MARILLVEDNPDDELLILRALKKCNVSEVVDVARDGEQAMGYILSFGLDSIGQSVDCPDLDPAVGRQSMLGFASSVELPAQLARPSG